MHFQYSELAIYDMKVYTVYKNETPIDDTCID